MPLSTNLSHHRIKTIALWEKKQKGETSIHWDSVSNKMIHALFSAILALAMQIALTAAIAPPNSVTMKAINNAGAPIEIFWINPSNKEFVKQTPKAVRNGTESSINSFEGHDFIARFQKHIEGVETSWTKLGREEKVIITYDPTTNRMNNKQLTKLDEVKEIINSASVECNAHEGDEFTNCITNQVMVEMNRLTESKGEIKKYRDIMADRLTNYICNDPAVKPTKPMETKTKVIGGKQYRLDYFVDLPESKVYVINNFITPQQCNHLQQSLSPYDSAVVMTHDGTVEMAASSTKAPNQYRYYLDEEYPSEDVMM